MHSSILYYFISTCIFQMYVCVCARARARVCVCVCVCDYRLWQSLICDIDRFVSEAILIKGL